jgi:sugar lactone lactonase YvrE
MRAKFIGLFTLSLLLLLALGGPLGRSALAAKAFPGEISLPDGFRPEGIVVGHGTTIFAGSLADGAIYAADLRTGEGEVLVTPPSGRIAVGLDFDERTNYVYVAGGPTGQAYVYDGGTGAEAGVFQLTTATPTFINDAIVTADAVYFTDSSQPALYRIPLLAGGGLPEPSAVQEIPLGGEYSFIPGQFNANGIEASPDGRWLIVVNSTTGTLYRVDPASGEATAIDLGPDTVPNGDGILLRGMTLYVVQNFFNQVAVVELSDDVTSGEIVDHFTDPAFDIPTTIARLGSALYVVNARFTTPPTPDTEYSIVKLP